MTGRSPRVFTIPAGAPFLETLAAAILDGFPLGKKPTVSEIARYTILLPTRRAARRLEEIFFAKGEGQGVLLPRIRPIGDIDESFFEDVLPEGAAASLPQAVSRTAREFVLIDLIGKWAKSNPVARLAQEIAASPHQAVNLATSLAELVDGLETEEIDQSRIPGLYDLESARHREAILEFLGLIRERLPSILYEQGLVGPMQRRSMLLRYEARRLTDSQSPWPIIAAGSTASIPATRELLAAVSRLPAGAVVLPGLDTHLDKESWENVREQHPQFALKQFLDALALSRDAVTSLLPTETNGRDWLASEITRPPETAEAWKAVAENDRARLVSALEGVELIEARGLREEAQVIALIMRETLEIRGKTGSLVTPDRQLARRVKQELARLGVAVDDSAGEPLIRFGGASLIALLADAVLGDFSPELLMALFKHELFQSGATQRSVELLDLAVFRAGGISPELARLEEAVAEARQKFAQDKRSSPALRRYIDRDWADAAELVRRVSDCLMPLSKVGAGTFGDHLKLLIEAGQMIAGEKLWEDDAGDSLRALIGELEQSARYLENCTFAQALTIIAHNLAIAPLHLNRISDDRLSILGLLEARLVNPDVTILGGLNEGRWPAQPDSGPWLNRPMRAILGMQQPERQIGQTAHDFAQALGCGQVYLVWSRQMADAPAIPSRWVLRLQTLMKAAGLEPRRDGHWQLLAQGISQPDSLAPCKRPAPRPPVEARPRRLSVTRIEALIRDPYAVYARYVLGLEPLDEIGAEPSFAARGTIFHEAIGGFLQKYPEYLPANALQELLAFGRLKFAELGSDPDTGTFWWAQFERVARWFVENETGQRRAVERIFAEAGGRLELLVAGRKFTLTCRADRIDVFENGTARIVDYKTGAVPSGPKVLSGLNPQLTLEAAMLARGAIELVGMRTASELVYVKLGGGDPAGEWKPPKLDRPASKCAEFSLGRLIELLVEYASPSQAYLPRWAIEHEDEVADYDHLSRFREWALSGRGT